MYMPPGVVGWRLGRPCLVRVRPGGLPALVSAGRCCWAEGQPLPLWCCCGGRGLPSDRCNGHPTHREPTRGRLWVVGGVGPCKMPVSAVMHACWPPQCRPWSNSRPTWARIYGTHRHETWHRTTPNPQATSSELPVGWVPVAVGRRHPMNATTALERPETGRGPFEVGPFLGCLKNRNPRASTSKIIFLLCFVWLVRYQHGAGT